MVERVAAAVWGQKAHLRKDAGVIRDISQVATSNKAHLAVTATQRHDQ